MKEKPWKPWLLLSPSLTAVFFEFPDHRGLADTQKFCGLAGGPALVGRLPEHIMLHGFKGLYQSGSGIGILEGFTGSGDGRRLGQPDQVIIQLAPVTHGHRLFDEIDQLPDIARK